MTTLARFVLLMAGAATAACSPSPRENTATTPAVADPHSAMPEMQAPKTVHDWATGAQLFDQLGDFHRGVSTRSPEAQKFFDQGMRLMYAFNHDEATRSFAQAAAIDGSCAMCFWGVALTVGPNYNMPMMVESRAQVAYQALQEAKRNAGNTTSVEQALIEALGQRYPGAQPLDPSNSAPVLAAYAKAMAAVAKTFPNDDDVQALYAESLMNLNPWKLWTADHKPMPGTTDIVRTLENVLRRDPNHPGANHYYVHAIEASGHPEKALASAERLRDMMPAAGHLDHMPAHIMQLVGRYEDAAEANRKGAAADVAYFSKIMPPDYYGMYLAHNYQFLAYSAAMEGRRAETLEATRNAIKSVPERMLLSMPGIDWYMTELYSGLLRFGLWDQMLAEKAPNSKLPGYTGGYLYGRAVALAAKGQIEAAKATLADLQALVGTLPADAGAGLNSTGDVLAVASLIAQARIADAEGRGRDAIALLKQAAAKDDGLAYDEPRDWFFPPRHLLGAALLKNHQAADAEAVYRTDLQRNPDNGWALFGLSQALKAQQKNSEAVSVDNQFREAWKNADVALTASAF